MRGMRGDPGKEWMKKREEQQRDSDLDMLVRASHNSVSAMAGQITFFLGRHKQNPPSMPDSSGYKFKTMCNNILRLDLPKYDGDVRHLMVQMANMKMWLNGGRGVGSNSMLVAKDLLIKSMEGPKARGDWAVKLMDVFDGLAWIASSNLASYGDMSPPQDGQTRNLWSQAVGKMIDQVLRKNAQEAESSQGGSGHNRLGVVATLWQADDCKWVADQELWGCIQAIGTDRVSQAHEQNVEQFIAFQKRHQLSQEIGERNKLMAIKPIGVAGRPKI